MGKHHGKFDWKRYARYQGTSKDFWTDKNRRQSERHRKMARYRVTLEIESGLAAIDFFDLFEERVLDIWAVKQIDLYEVDEDE
jgi:hypothetical protein